MFPKNPFRLLIASAAALASTLIVTSAVASSDYVTLDAEDRALQKEVSRLIEERLPLDSFGVALANIHDFSPEVAAAAKRELRFNDRLQIISVRKGSVADKLGLKPGDQLLQINSYYVDRGKRALDAFTQRVVPGVDWNGAIETVVIRDGYGQSHCIGPRKGRS